MPNAPTHAHREPKAGVVAYRIGVALRFISDVTRPILGWTRVIAEAIILGILYFLVKVIFEGLRP